MEPDKKKVLNPVKLINRIFISLGLGIVFGALEAMNLLFTKDPRLIAVLNVILFRALSGFFIATSNLSIGPIKRGIIISILMTLPALLRLEFLGRSIILVIMFFASIVSGAFIGFVVGKMEKRMQIVDQTATA